LSPDTSAKVVALTADLMDRSKISRGIPGVSFTLTGDVDVVVVDLAKGVDQVSSVRATHPAARIVAYGPHVDDQSMNAARAAGADLVLPRSRFFRDPFASVVAAAGHSAEP
jgi:DNA-binding NarL/FixJ family response regulator